MTTTRALAAAAAVSVLLALGYLAAGGATYEPTKPPNPCTAGAPDSGGAILGEAQRIGVIALGRSACELGVGREELVLSLSGRKDLGIDTNRRNEAFRTGIRQAIDEEEQAGNIGGIEASLLRTALEVLPVDAVLDRLFPES
jgi:hypothetical protein